MINGSLAWHNTQNKVPTVALLVPFSYWAHGTDIIFSMGLPRKYAGCHQQMLTYFYLSFGGQGHREGKGTPKQSPSLYHQTQIQKESCATFLRVGHYVCVIEVVWAVKHTKETLKTQHTSPTKSNCTTSQESVKKPRNWFYEWIQPSIVFWYH